MLADNFIESVSHGIKKILVCLKDNAVQVKLDHGLRFFHRVKDTLQNRTLNATRCNVGCKFDDLRRLSVFAKNRVVSRFKPYHLAIFAHTRHSTRREFTAAKLFPEFPVFFAITDFTRDKHRMMPTNNFLQRETHCFQEIIIGRQNLAINRKLDNSHRQAQRIYNLLTFLRPVITEK